jgi:hypothetical protein
LELYNRHIAIVTVLDKQIVRHVDLQTEITSSHGEVLVAGRAFKSGCLMSAKAELVSRSHDLNWCFPVSLQFDLPIAQEYLSIWKPVDGIQGDPVV